MLSAEGIQQGDPLGSMLFCLGTYNLVASLSSEFTVNYPDDGTIGGSIADIETNIQQIVDQEKALGLFLNVDKSSVNPVLSAFQAYSMFMLPMPSCWVPPQERRHCKLGTISRAESDGVTTLPPPNGRCHYHPVALSFHYKILAHSTNMTCLFATVLEVHRF